MNDTERAAHARTRLNSIIIYAATGEGHLRTLLDEWAAYEYGGGLLTRGGKQRWFNNSCPWTEWERLARHMDWITPAAAEVLRRGKERHPEVKKPAGGEPAPFRIIVDHAVPVKVIGEAVRLDGTLMRADRLREFLHHHFKRGVLMKTEDDVLSRTPAEKARTLRDAMPHGWQAGGDPFARYKAAGLTNAPLTDL
jgi:hypothetical protein